jgi:hypothetical protein
LCRIKEAIIGCQNRVFGRYRGLKKLRGNIKNLDFHNGPDILPKMDVRSLSERIKMGNPGLVAGYEGQIKWL